MDWTQSSLGFCQPPEDTGQSPWDHQPTLSSRKTCNQNVKSHFPSGRLFAQWDTATCLEFLIHQYFPQDDKCPANKRRQLPTLSETRAFSWRCGRAWLVDMSREAGGRRRGCKEKRKEEGIRTTALNLCRFCHESVERREETEAAQILVQNRIYLGYFQSSYRMLSPEWTIRNWAELISV